MQKAAIKDLENPDRVLIGGDDNEAMDLLSQIYKTWYQEEKFFLPIYGVVN